MNKALIILSLVVFFTSCDQRFKEVEKPAWELEDYETVHRDILFSTPEGDRFPGIGNQEEVFRKLIDQKNISRILDNKELGLKYRNEVADRLFYIYKYLDEGYSKVNEKDKYVYPLELVLLKEWGFFIQLKYFLLGNEEILNNTTNPNDKYTSEVLRANELAAVGNFATGIAFLTTEDAIRPDALDEYARIIDKYYPLLLKNYPNADYTKLYQTVRGVRPGIKREKLKATLASLEYMIAEHIKSKAADTADTPDGR